MIISISSVPRVLPEAMAKNPDTIIYLQCFSTIAQNSSQKVSRIFLSEISLSISVPPFFLLSILRQLLICSIMQESRISVFAGNFFCDDELAFFQLKNPPLKTLVTHLSQSFIVGGKNFSNFFAIVIPNQIQNRLQIIRQSSLGLDMKIFYFDNRLSN